MGIISEQWMSRIILKQRVVCQRYTFSVINPPEVWHLQINELRERWVPNARSAVGHCFDGGSSGKVQRQIQRVEFGQCTAK